MISTVQGHVNPQFEVVRQAFAENFARRRELGGACCAYHHGEKVVDLWGGVRNRQTGEPWEEDTMVVVHSATKGLAAMTLAIAHSRGWLDYEEPIDASTAFASSFSVTNTLAGDENPNGYRGRQRASADLSDHTRSHVRCARSRRCPF